MNLRIDPAYQLDGIAIVALEGRLLLGPEGAQLEAITRELLTRKADRIVFDFTGLTHIDSTGIGRCITSLNLIMEAGGQLAIVASAGQVRDSFRVTQLDRVFRFFDSLNAATAALS